MKWEWHFFNFLNNEKNENIPDPDGLQGLFKCVFFNFLKSNINKYFPDPYGLQGLRGRRVGAPHRPIYGESGLH